nr:MAG TPA: hypothetical protein [Caudoviricetes sp.]
MQLLVQLSLIPSILEGFYLDIYTYYLVIINYI